MDISDSKFTEATFILPTVTLGTLLIIIEEVLLYNLLFGRYLWNWGCFRIFISNFVVKIYPFFFEIFPHNGYSMGVDDQFENSFILTNVVTVLLEIETNFIRSSFLVCFS